MKKIIVLILTAMMLITPVFADVDLSSMTDQELLALKNQVNTEIASRGSIDMIPSGRYVVGRDIKAGQYTFYGTVPEGGGMGTTISWFASEEDMNNGESIDWEYLHLGEQTFINLSDGMGVKFSDSVPIEQTKASWMP